MMCLLKYISSSGHCEDVETTTKPAVLSALRAQGLSGGVDGIQEPGLLGRMAGSKIGQEVFKLSLENLLVSFIRKQRSYQYSVIMFKGRGANLRRLLWAKMGLFENQ